MPGVSATAVRFLGKDGPWFLSRRIAGTMPHQESVLELARRHVAEGEIRVTEQEARISELVRNGQETKLAVSLLDTFKTALASMREHLAYEEDKAAKHAS
jgi:hypothetical protein